MNDLFEGLSELSVGILELIGKRTVAIIVLVLLIILVIYFLA